MYESLKDTRDFGLRDQVQRPAVSIASNIAEGSERPTKDFKRFLRMGSGSAAELRTQAYSAAKVGRLSNQQMKHIVEETKVIARMLTA